MSGSFSCSNNSGGGEKDVEQQQQQQQQQQQLLVFSKGERVEVSSNEEGFKGAWFVATVVDDSINSNKLLVEYETLLAEDHNGPLKECITIPFIRPLPPDPILPHQQSSFQINDIVDAFHRDAWWAGVITRVLDGYNFVVSFQNPDEDITFNGSSLRFHLEWLDGKWIRPQFQKMKRQKVGALDTEKVKQSRGKRRAKKSNVGIFHASATGGNKSNARGGSEELIDINKDARELEDENPSVPLEKDHHQQQQQSVDSKIQINIENNGPNGGEDNQKGKRGRPPLKSPTGQSNEKRKRGRPPLERPINLVKREKDSSDASTGEASETHSKTRDAEVDDEMPSKIFRGLPPLSTEEVISSQTIMNDLRVSPDLCTVNQGADRQNANVIVVRNEFVDMNCQSWPFDKCSPLWTTIEAMQIFQKTPQKPHFSSLNKCEEQFREGLAIGCMVTFASTVDRISKLQISDPTSIIDKYLRTLVELENHGFDVEPFRACLNELLAKKAKESQLQEESKQLVSEIAGRQLEKARLENEISEIEAKIREHQQKHGASTLKKKLVDLEIAMLESKKDQISEDIRSVCLDFQKIVASPL